MLIDWHNYGYTILGLRFSPTSAIIKVDISQPLNRQIGQKCGEVRVYGLEHSARHVPWNPEIHLGPCLEFQLLQSPDS